MAYSRRNYSDVTFISPALPGYVILFSNTKITSYRSGKTQHIFEILPTIIILRLKLNFFLSGDMKGPPCAVSVRNGPQSSKLDDKI